MLDQASNEEQFVLIQRTAKLLPVPSGTPKKARRSSFRLLADICRAIGGYTAEDLARLKEGAVLQVEGKGQTAIAEAQAKVAEAAERHAKAEHERAEAVKARAEAVKATAEAYAIKRKADGEHAKDMATAVNQVAEAISRIKPPGGEFAFDIAQLEKLLSKGQRHFPDDKHIQTPDVQAALPSTNGTDNGES
ncbi:MAG: hypothetical protein ACLQM8_17675 [Limisphaerales bacterium]